MKDRLKINCRNVGQSLIELLLAISLGALFIASASGALVLALRSGSQSKSLRVASLLTQEWIDKTRILSERDWHNIYNLFKDQPYRLIVSGGLFNAVAGTENVILDGIDYARSFSVSNFFQDSVENPSTQIVRVTISWLQGGDTASLVRSQYLTRYKNLVWRSNSPGDGNESSIFDSQIIGGAAWNTIMWQGGGGTVGFRIASDQEGDGPWNYLGPNGNPSVYYQPAGPNVQSLITASNHNNQQYLRYRIYYLSGSPQVNDVIINYSP